MSHTTRPPPRIDGMVSLKVSRTFFSSSKNASFQKLMDVESKMINILL